MSDDKGKGSPSEVSSPSGRASKGPNKAFKVLESQGIIVGKTMGSGSYAKVKSAYDLQRKHRIAIKIINKKKAFDEYLTKFLPREIDAMKTLSSHYSLVQFYQIIETTSRYFFIMELAENGDLLRAIKAKTYIPENESGRYFIHLHDGMKYMHGKGLVHRDIKCENLVLSRDDTLKITDFGFAKRIGKAKNGCPLLSETYCGSYAYAPPEILKGVPYDPEMADVWSMGVVLFTMVYGRLPYDDGDHKKLVKQVSRSVQFPAKPEVSDECRILILKILSKSSDRVPLKNVKLDPWFKGQRSQHGSDLKQPSLMTSVKDSKKLDVDDSADVCDADKNEETLIVKTNESFDDEHSPGGASMSKRQTTIDTTPVLPSATASGAS